MSGLFGGKEDEFTWFDLLMCILIGIGFASIPAAVMIAVMGGK